MHEVENNEAENNEAETEAAEERGPKGQALRVEELSVLVQLARIGLKQVVERMPANQLVAATAAVAKAEAAVGAPQQ